MHGHFGIGEVRREIRIQKSQSVIVRTTQQEYVRFQDAKTRKYPRIRVIFGARGVDVAKGVIEEAVTHFAANALKLRVGRRSITAAVNGTKQQRGQQELRGKPD